ncbi:lytic transglycosylase domain-containing protein [Chitinimonas lacunae]|uniref:Transglycosylase SLT domain-containing protein n=1 Tax=Chitinimonas lacunae TaxID=1963018 RepID=A0ABV8MUV2_9NEIS
MNASFRILRFAILALGLDALVLAAPVDDIRAAREAFRQGNLHKLSELIERTDGGTLEPYPRYWLLSSQIDTMPTERIEEFLERYQGSYLADRLRGDWLRQLGRVGDWDRFEAEWPKLVGWEAGSDLHCYRLQLSQVRNERARFAEARALWFSPKPLPEPCGPVFEALFQQGLLTQDDAWGRVRLALQAGSADFALQLLPRLQRPDGLTARSVREVAAQPDRALARNDLSSRGGRELALYAISQAGRRNVESGRQLLERLAPRLPEADRRYAWSRVAWLAARKQHPEALLWYRRGLDEGLGVEEREWRIRAALRVGDWREVAQQIMALPADRRSDPAWRYWLGRTHKHAGETLEANRLFAELAGEHHFYGLLAREELGTYADASVGRYRPSSEEIQTTRQLPGVARALALYQIGWRLEAVREWNWAMRNLNDRQLLAAADLARQSEWYDRAIYAAERTRDIHDFGLRFLAPYREVTQHYARSLDLDEAWVYGLIRQESRFISVARSGVGAQGLMQLMPATAEWVAKRIGLRSFQAETVNEIGTNVQLGTYYLRHVFDTLSSQPVLATAAYNAGPGRARAWQGGRAIEGAVYVETIPFSETRDYVKKVMSNAIYYAQAFGRGSTSLKARLGVVPARGNAAVEVVIDNPSAAPSLEP